MSPKIARAVDASPRLPWKTPADRRPTSATGTFTRYPALVQALPPLIRQQRRLAARIAAVAEAVKDEKTIRGQIDQLLVRAGLQKSEVVTCAGYDVRHNEKAGSHAINQDVLIGKLVHAGMAERLVRELLLASTEIGQPAMYATVTPTKGAKVQAPEPLQMAKASPKKGAKGRV